MDKPNKTVGLKYRNGSITIINGTSCSELECRETGCSFPYCATLTDEKYATEEEARAVHPDLIVERG